MSPPFEMDNRGKRSVVLDLGTPDGTAAAFELLAAADVFITNVRPGALRRIGLDFEAVAARNPRLVYGLITGYGMTGPDADRAAYDVAAFWARSGLAHLLTRPGDSPPFQRGGMGDHTAGMTLAAAVCAALVARARTGTGQLVSTSLYRQGAYTVSFDLNTFLLTGHPIAIGQRETMGNPCMNNYTAGDGRRFWIVGLESGRHWPALCRAVGRSEWLTDPRYADPRTRAANAAELIAELDVIFATKPLDEWAKAFAGEPDFFWSPINSIEDVLGRRTVPRHRRHRLRTRRRLHRADGRHACGLSRHAVGAAVGCAETGRAHRRSPRRAQVGSGLIRAACRSCARNSSSSSLRTR